MRYVHPVSTNVNINQNGTGCGCLTVTGLGCGFWLFAPFMLALLGAIFWGIIAAVVVIVLGYLLAALAGVIMSIWKDN